MAKDWFRKILWFLNNIINVTIKVKDCCSLPNNWLKLTVPSVTLLLLSLAKARLRPAA
jgi:hypothetical protein